MSTSLTIPDDGNLAEGEAVTDSSGGAGYVIGIDRARGTVTIGSEPLSVKAGRRSGKTPDILCSEPARGLLTGRVRQNRAQRRAAAARERRR